MVSIYVQSMFPEIVQDIQEFKEVSQVTEILFADFEQFCQDKKDNLFIATANNDMLIDYGRIFRVALDENMNQNRDKILAKTSANGIVNLESIKKLIGAYIEGTVQYRFYDNPYTLYIMYMVDTSIANLSDLESQLLNLLPCNIALILKQFEVNWYELNDKNKTFLEFTDMGLTLDEARKGDWVLW